VSITHDIEEFVRLHRAHGRPVGDATDPMLTGCRVTIECPSGVTFVRHVTAGEALIDLAGFAQRN
jgi:hypothetical protein